jgi:hypothetical protein
MAEPGCARSYLASLVSTARSVKIPSQQNLVHWLKTTVARANPDGSTFSGAVEDHTATSGEQHALDLVSFPFA